MGGLCLSILKPLLTGMLQGIRPRMQAAGHCGGLPASAWIHGAGSHLRPAAGRRRRRLAALFATAGCGNAVHVQPSDGRRQHARAAAAAAEVDERDAAARRGRDAASALQRLQVTMAGCAQFSGACRVCLASLSSTAKQLARGKHSLLRRLRLGWRSAWIPMSKSCAARAASHLHFLLAMPEGRVWLEPFA